MRDFIRHFFTPHHTNNHRAKLLHSQSILVVVLFFLIGSIFVSTLETSFPQILGATVDISSEELLSYTNKKRSEKGLSPLTLDPLLTVAAHEKAQDMFENNYWAHNSPSGTTPWVFIKKSGYTYTYAGENLARGFNTSPSVVDAWMASPTHRDNMLSSSYENVGFAVVSGRLNGEDTVLVVEMLGGKNIPAIARQPDRAGEIAPASSSVQGQQNVMSAVLNKSIINSDVITQNISLVILGVFIFTFIIDMLIVKRRKIIRVVGHNTDHMLFLGALIICILLIGKGVIA